MASESTHATRIDARGMARDMILLQDEDAASGPRKMQRRGAAVQAAADDDDIGYGHESLEEKRQRAALCDAQMRTTAFTAASVFGNAASSATVIGFTGGRRR